MKKLILAFAITSLALTACSKPENKSNTEQTAQNPDPAHTAENSLDWHGKYTGTLPCADCSGIETAIQLNKNKTYEINETYLGKAQGKGQNFVEKSGGRTHVRVKECAEIIEKSGKIGEKSGKIG